MSSKTNWRENPKPRPSNTSKARQDMHVERDGKLQGRGTLKTAATPFPPKNSTPPIKGLPDREEVTRFAQDLVSSEFWQSCSLEASHGPAEWKCLHCGDYMCSSCTTLHKRGKKSRQHCILHKSRQLDEDSILKDLFCSRHGGREKEKYCKTDKKKVCKKCETESHSHHDVVSLSNMAGEERSHVGKCLDQVDKSIPKYTKIFERLDNYIAETENQAVENCRIIDEAVEDVISMVKTRGMQLKTEENTRFSLELRENVVKKRYDLELDMQRMKKTLFECRKFLETSNDIELIDGASNYIEKLSSLIQPDYEKVDKELSPVTRITVQHVRAQLEGLDIKEVKHEGSRLSQLAGSKLTEGNPAIADLSDMNTPINLGEKFSELYDNQWTDAFEELLEEGLNEDKAISELVKTVTEANKYCITQSEDFHRKLKDLMKQFGMNPEKLPTEVSKQIKDHRKSLSISMVQDIQERFCKEQNRNKDDRMKAYARQCIAVCWFMTVQDPPVFMDSNLPKHNVFDTEKFIAYTKIGKKIHFLVWPALYLHEGGPLLSKGVAQGK